MINRSRRPGGVWVLVVMFLYLSIAGFVRLIGAIRFWTFLSSLPLRQGPFYIAASGLVWGLLGLGVVVGLWSGRPWTPWAARAVGAFYLVSYWVDQLWLAQPGANHANWPFMAGASIFFCLVVLWVLYRLVSRSYFKAN